jgi:hypothetical protein
MMSRRFHRCTSSCRAHACNERPGNQLAAVFGRMQKRAEQILGSPLPDGSALDANASISIWLQQMCSMSRGAMRGDMSETISMRPLAFSRRALTYSATFSYQRQRTCCQNSSKPKVNGLLEPFLGNRHPVEGRWKTAGVNTPNTILRGLFNVALCDGKLSGHYLPHKVGWAPSI